MTDLLTSTAWRIDRMTDVAQSSAEWARHKTEGGRIGSSQCAAVFPGVSTTISRSDLLSALYGVPHEIRSAYVQQLMQEGVVMEPVLRQECAELLSRLACRELWFTVPHQFTASERTHGILESSSPDCIVGDSDGAVALVEIKWRAASKSDCGWGANNAELGPTVWCQVQHQMHVTGIHIAYVYSGARDGSRRLWRVAYDEPFRDMFVVALGCLLTPDTFNPYRTGAKRLIEARMRQTAAFTYHADKNE